MNNDRRRAASESDIIPSLSGHERTLRGRRIGRFGRSTSGRGGATHRRRARSLGEPGLRHLHDSIGGAGGASWRPAAHRGGRDGRAPRRRDGLPNCRRDGQGSVPGRRRQRHPNGGSFTRPRPIPICAGWAPRPRHWSSATATRGSAMSGTRASISCAATRSSSSPKITRSWPPWCARVCSRRSRPRTTPDAMSSNVRWACPSRSKSTCAARSLSRKATCSSSAAMDCTASSKKTRFARLPENPCARQPTSSSAAPSSAARRTTSQ